MRGIESGFGLVVTGLFAGRKKKIIAARTTPKEPKRARIRNVAWLSFILELRVSEKIQVHAGYDGRIDIRLASAS